MKFFELYLSFCRSVGQIKLPQINFKEKEQLYDKLLKSCYGLTQKVIGRATFFVMIISLVSILYFSLIINLSILYAILCSVIVSTFISYKFNFYLYKGFLKKGKELTSYLYLIRIDFSLIELAKQNDEGVIMEFIKLIINKQISISEDFKKILSHVHSGAIPEEELRLFESPSNEFNKYLIDIVEDNKNPFFGDDISNSLEDEFKIYMKELSTKISLIFFLGIFFPIGLCIFIIFISFNKAIILVSIPIFLYFLKYLFHNFIKIDHFFMGMIKKNSDYEKKKFCEVLNLINRFSFHLEKNIAPEKAFINAYLEIINSNSILNKILSSEISSFLSGSLSFTQLINSFKNKLDEYRYSLVFNSINRMLKTNSNVSSRKIREIVNVLKNHIKLEKKIENIFRGERIKVFLFTILLPVILGALGSLVSIFPMIIRDFSNIQDINNLTLFKINFSLFDIILLLFVLLFCNFISVYYFFTIISYRKKRFFLIFSEFLLILSFLISLFNIFPLFWI
jgi:hypothetical protein